MVLDVIGAGLLVIAAGLFALSRRYPPREAGQLSWAQVARRLRA
jgi:sugar/nucleoside kinase (ribokinase family)